MADDPPPVDAIPKAWMQLQAQVLEAQQSFWTRMTSVQKGGQDGSASGNASNVWDEARKLAEGWLTGLGPGAGSPGEGEGIAQVTLRRMMDPNQFLFAGTDEVNQTIQRLVDGTDSADIGRLEHHVLKATREWIALREASVEYRMVAAEAWMRAFSRFSASMAEHPEKHAEGPRAVLNHWLETADDELIATQRTETFLKAQRKLLRAAVDYRLRERDIIERWCETHSIPTRTEVDDLHATVHRMAREMRALRKALAQTNPSAAAASCVPSSGKED